MDIKFVIHLLFSVGIPIEEIEDKDESAEGKSDFPDEVIRGEGRREDRSSDYGALIIIMYLN